MSGELLSVWLYFTQTTRLILLAELQSRQIIRISQAQSKGDKQKSPAAVSANKQTNK